MYKHKHYGGLLCRRIVNMFNMTPGGGGALQERITNDCNNTPKCFMILGISSDDTESLTFEFVKYFNSNPAN